MKTSPLIPVLILSLGAILSGCRDSPSRESSTTKSSSDSPSASALVHDMQQTIDSLAGEYPETTVAVSVLDESTGTIYHRNADRLFHAASTMKIPVLIELFRQAEQGRFSLADSLVIRNTFRSIVDSSEYAIEDDTDDTIYAMIGDRMSFRDLADHMITISSNLATNLLIEYLSADSVQATSEKLGTTRMRTLRGVEDLKAYEQGLSNRATSRDLALLLERIRTGTAVSAESDRIMREILFAQRFNSMIPAGLPAGSRAAHKTGSITGIHHDAAIVYPTGGAPYVLVIMTEGFPEDSVSASLGSEITRGVHAFLRPDEGDM